MKRDKIIINPSKTADTRSCDWSAVSKEQLLASSIQHKGDIAKGFEFFKQMIEEAVVRHDHDKLTDIDGFHRDFQTGFKQTDWWDNHRKVNRHHLLHPDGIPTDVNLVDVLDLIVDCVMAGLARSGTIYPITIAPETLMNAFENTVELLKSQITVEPQK